jgi:hypothetical protein
MQVRVSVPASAADNSARAAVAFIYCHYCHIQGLGITAVVQQHAGCKGTFRQLALLPEVDTRAPLLFSICVHQATC